MGGGRHTPALARGRLEDMALVDVEEILVTDTPAKDLPRAVLSFSDRTVTCTWRWAAPSITSRNAATAIRARRCVFVMTGHRHRTIRLPESRDSDLISIQSANAT